MTPTVAFQDHEKLLRHFAWRVLRRLHAAGAASVQIDDVFQELVVAWCKARDSFDPGLQVPFTPYLRRGMMDHINRWVSRELRQTGIVAFSLDETSNDAEEDGTRHAIIADPNATSAEDMVLEIEKIALARKRIETKKRINGELVPPELLQFFDLLVSPPPVLYEMQKGMRARSDYARSRGLIPMPVPRRITVSMIFDLLGLSSTQRLQVNRALHALFDLEMSK